MKTLKNLMNDERGTTAVEYGLVLGGASVFVIGLLGAAGSDLYNVLFDVADAIESTNRTLRLHK